MRTDLILIPTMDYGRHFLCLPYSILLVLILISGFAVKLEAQISCIAQVRVSLNSQGQAALSPQMFVRGDIAGHSVMVENSPLSDPAIVDCSFLNQKVNVIVINAEGARCWSSLIVEDKRDLEVSIRDTAILCSEFNSDDTLFDLITVEDNCVRAEDLTISFNTVRDSIFDSKSDTLRRDLCIWSITGPNGELEVFSSFIYITRLNIDRITFPSDTVVYSSIEAVDTAITGVPTVSGMILSEQCNLNVVTSIQGPILSDCDKRLKFNRVWSVVDVKHWEIIAEEVQTIRFIDTTLKTIIAPDLDVEIIDDCQAELVIRDFNLDSSGIGIIRGQYKSIIANGNIVFPGDRLDVVDGDTVIIEYGAINDCFERLEPVVDTIVVTVPNNISIITCNGHAVALAMDDNTTRSIRLERLFTGFVQSCGDYTLVGARTQAVCGQQDTIFSNRVMFCADDIGQSVSILVTAVNNNGMSSTDTCEIVVEIQDKRSPLVDCTITSDTLYYSAIDSLVRIGDLNRYFNFISSDNIISVTGSGSGMGGSLGSSFEFSAAFNQSNGLIESSMGLDSFNCAFVDAEGIGSYNFELKVNGSNGASISCPVSLTLLDTLNVCPTASNFISGRLLAYGRSGVKDADVTIGRNEEISSWISTNISGDFMFDIDVEAKDLTVDYADSWYSDITSNDLFLLQEILFGTYEPNELEEASADINNDGVINTFDFIIMKRVLLGEEPEVIVTTKPWSIFAKESVCYDVEECFDGRFSLDSFDDYNNIELWAIKEGDIDQDAADQSESRSQNLINYFIDSETIRQRKGHSVRILTSEISQFTSMQVELEIPKEVDVYIDETIGLQTRRYNDRLRLIYAKGSQDKPEDIVIQFSEAQSALWDLQNLVISNELRPLIFLSNDKQIFSLNKIEEHTDRILDKGNALIYPNPGRGQSKVKLNHAWNAGPVNCEIYNNIGQLVWSHTVLKSDGIVEELLLPEHLRPGLYSVVITDCIQSAIKSYIKM